MKHARIKAVLASTLLLGVMQSCSTDVEEINTDLTSLDLEERRSRPESLDNDLITEWNDLIVELDQHATGMRPNAISRAFAYINLAAYETALPEMDDYESMADRYDELEINDREAPRRLDVLIALNACYEVVVDHFIYNVPANIDNKIAALAEEQEDDLSRRISDSTIRDSKEWGVYVANAVIAYSQTDAEAEVQILDPQPRSYEPPVGEGYWTYSADPERALFPYWGKVRTFAISSDETSSVPPRDAYSEDVDSGFYEQMMEVYEVSTTAAAEENDDLWIAEFWSDDVEGLMVSPPGRQIAIANQLIDEERLDVEEALVLMLKLGFSLNDAAVSTWADKYEYMVMRPSVYVVDYIDEDFKTNLYKFIFWPDPSFPGYPSGHSTFASAAAGVFIDAFGDITFTDRTHEGRKEFLGEPRTFTLTEMAEENAFSRIPLGVHIRMDCEEGLRLGYEIADAINDLDLRDRNDRRADNDDDDRNR